MPATSSHMYMMRPPWTLPAVFASATPIQRLSTETESDGGRAAGAATAAG